MTSARLAYVLKMYPRFSETFILNEILELERQGAEIHIFSLKKPDDGRFHADLSRVKAAVTYVPEHPLMLDRGVARAHRVVMSWAPDRYASVLASALRRRRRGALKRFSQAAYIAPRLAAQGLTHVHAHFASSATSVALYLHRLAGFSYSFTAHAKDIYRYGVSRAALRRKLSSARFAVTVSDYNMDYLRELGSDRVLRVYNGIDIELFKPNGTPPDDPPLILGVGRLVEKKGFDVLIRACDTLRRSGHHFRCLIVGKGELEQQLAELIRGLDIGSHVHLAGPMARDALLDLYPRSSAFAAPCVIGSDGNRDGLPTVLIEAMALGVPVVSTPVTGIPELVEHGRTGLLVPEKDPNALAGAMRRLLTEPDAARSMAMEARQRVEQSFDLRTNIRQLRLMFEQVTS